MNLVRVQVMFERRQHKALKKAARRTQKSVSQLLREITDAYLVQVSSEDDEVMQAIDHFRTIREKQMVYAGDPVHEARKERQFQMKDD